MKDIYITPMISDFPTQFNGYRLNQFLSMLDNQMLDVADAMVGIMNIADSLKNATDTNLDGIGEIVGLPRKKASSLYRRANVFLDDNEYRKALLFYVLWRGSDKSYESIHRIVEEVYGISIQIMELREIPNTLLLSLDNDGTNDYTMIPNLAPQGVNVSFATSVGGKLKVNARTISGGIEATIPGDSAQLIAQI